MTAPLRIVIGDTETSGLPPPGWKKGDPFPESYRCCELAWIELDEHLNVLQSDDSLIDPECRIPAEVSKIHGITNKDTHTAPTLDEYAQLVKGRIDGPVVLVAHKCLTPDHEVLTPAGWQSLKDYSEDTELAVFNLSTSEVLFERPAALLRKDYTGLLHCWDNENHQGRYTEGHKIVWHSVNNAKWSALPVEDVAVKGLNSVYIPSAGVLQVPFPLALSEPFVRFMEAVRADGNIQSYPVSGGTFSRYVRFSLKKERKIRRIKELATALALEFTETVRGDGATIIRFLKSKVTDDVFEMLGEGKVYGMWLLRLSVQAREWLIDEIAHWDGSVETSLTKLKSVSISTVDALQAMSVLSGRASKTKKGIVNSKGFSREDGVINTVTFRKNNYVKIGTNHTTEHYTGQVVCPTTSTGAFVVRRNGVVWVTGNCDFDLPFFEKVFDVRQTFCTLALARAAMPTAKNHKLQTLRELLKVEVDGTAHRAMGDLEVLRAMLLKLIPGSGRDFRKHLDTPVRMLSVMPIGKFKGLPILSVPNAYREWMLAEMKDMHPDMRYTLEQLRGL